MKSTPLNNLTSYRTIDPNMAFAYFLNAQDNYLYRAREASYPNGFDTNELRYKGFSDKARSSTSVFGRAEGPFSASPILPFNCVDNLKLTKYAQKYYNKIYAAEFRRAQMFDCASQYILRRAFQPWYLYEPQGSPLTKYPESFYDIPPAFCQPLMSGNSALHVMSGRYLEKQMGMAPVAHWSKMDRFVGTLSPDDLWILGIQAIGDLMNEDEYYLSETVKLAYNNILKSGTNPTFLGYGLYETKLKAAKYPPKNFNGFLLTNLPCVIDHGQTPPNWPIVVDIPPPPPPPDLPSDCQDNSGGGPPPPPPPPPPPCEPLSLIPEMKVPSGISVKVQNSYYCPNVEVIRDPSNPFSPRQYILDDQGAPVFVGVPGAGVMDNNFPITGDPDPIVGTDRAYSKYTDGPWLAQWNEGSGCGNKTVRGYSYWSDKPAPKAYNEPEVQCAVVPVDVLSTRLDAFHVCMGYRIKKNEKAFLAYLKSFGEGIKSYSNGELKAMFTEWNRTQKPCSTKYYQPDKGFCGAPLSITQCCHVLLKDIVPANQLKIRTCDPVLDVRRSAAQGLLKKSRDQNKPKIALVEKYFSSGIAFVKKNDDLEDAPSSSSSVSSSVSEPMDVTIEKNYKKDFKLVKDLTRLAPNCLYNGFPVVPPEYHFSYWVRTYTDMETGDVVGVHMPYMRWWDTGVSAGMPWKYGSFINTLGGYDYIVGVGRERRTEDDIKQLKKTIKDFEDEHKSDPDYPLTSGSLTFSSSSTSSSSWSSSSTSSSSPEPISQILPLEQRVRRVNYPNKWLYESEKWFPALNPEAPTGPKHSITLEPGADLPQLRQAGNLGGWAELVLHQAYTMRYHNLQCIGRYEKLFKEGGSDDYVLFAGGGSFNTMGKTVSKPKPSGSGSMTVVEQKGSLPWPLGWRGYISDSTLFFPNSGGGGFWDQVSYLTNSHGDAVAGYDFDRAMPGDIGVFVFDGVPYSFFIQDIGFPASFKQYTDLVSQGRAGIQFNNNTNRWEVYDLATSAILGSAPPDKLFINGWNFGKFPSAAGVTNQWASGTVRVIYRDKVPDGYKLTQDPSKLETLWAGVEVPIINPNTYAPAGGSLKNQPSCIDPDYHACVLPYTANPNIGGYYGWKQGALYRPSIDDSRVSNITAAQEASGMSPVSNMFSVLVNQGIDPPFHWRSGGGTKFMVSGGTGSVIKSTFCPPGPLPATNKPMLYPWKSCGLNVDDFRAIPVPKPVKRAP